MTSVPSSSNRWTGYFKKNYDFWSYCITCYDQITKTSVLEKYRVPTYVMFATSQVSV